MDWMPQAVRDGIIVVLVISGPLVLAAAFIGLVIGVLQAATQVQEQTIGSALKIIGVFALIIVAGFWMFQYLNQYTTRTLTTAFTVIPHQTQKVVPPDRKENKGFENQFEERPLNNVEPPEKIESKFPQAGLPPDIPYAGKPSTPKISPSINKLLPPESPKIPSQAIMPNIPISDFQEPISLPNAGPKAEEENDQPPGEYFPPLNLVPGNPTEEQITNPNLLQRKETSSENPEEGTSPSWLE